MNAARRQIDELIQQRHSLNNHVTYLRDKFLSCVETLKELHEEWKQIDFDDVDLYNIMKERVEDEAGWAEDYLDDLNQHHIELNELDQDIESRERRLTLAFHRRGGG